MVLTKARAGLARSNATRAGYPLLRGLRVPLYALSNVARSGATRSNYHSSKPFISIDGLPFGFGRLSDAVGVLAKSLSIQDALNETPSTASFTTHGFVPKTGADVIVTLGSRNNLRREFAGTVLSTRTYYVGEKPAAPNMVHDVALIDYTWGLARLKVSGRFVNTTVGAVAASLMPLLPDYTLHVDPDIAAEGLDTISFTEVDVPSALRQLVKRVGGDWLCDYNRTIRLFFEDTSETPPTILNTVHPSLAGLAYTRDLSQVVTRVYVEGGGVNAFATVAAGETILPVEDSAWYLTSGGVVLSGQQRIRYGGKYAGGGGGLVGTGAAPSGAPTLTQASGTGLTSGTRDYAVTFETAAGQSVIGPRRAITVGPILAPETAPVASAPVLGSGPDAGMHDYAVTFGTASGETIPGPRITAATGETAAPPTYPIPDVPTSGLGPEPGAHDYAASFVTAAGETTVGPISPQVVTGPLAPPSTPVQAGAPVFGTGPETGPHGYAVAFVTAIGESVPGPVAALTTGSLAPPAAPVGAAPLHTGGGLPPNYPGPRKYAVTFVTAGGETTPSPIIDVTPPTLAPPPNAISVFIPGVPPGSGSLVNGGWYMYAMTYVDPTTGAETAGGPISGPHQANNVGIFSLYNVPAVNAYYACLYRTVAGGNTFYREIGPTFVGNIQQSGAMSDAVLVTQPQANPHGVVPAQADFALSAIPIGDATVTARKVYRSVAYGTALQLVTTLANNTATTYADSSLDSALGAAAPTTNTASLNRIALTNIPIGPASVTQRRLYRTVVNGSALQLLATLTNNSATTYLDSVPDASLGAPPLSVATALVCVVRLTGIPTGDSGQGVTARKVYRRSGGAGLRLLTTLANNSSTTFTDTVANAALGAAPPSVNTATLNKITLSAIPVGGPLVTARHLYRTKAGQPTTLLFLATLPNNTTTTFVDTQPDAALGGAAPVVNTASANQVQLSAIPVGAPTVLRRNIFRTMAGGTTLQLLVTLADNVTTTYLDAAPDASLGGATPPLTDTSGLTQPQGNVLAGSTSLQIANIGAFPPEGWAVIGNGQQVIRYHGISGNVLTGIPPSGPGAIEATIAYNSTVTASPQLVGILPSGDGAIRYQILKGDAVNLFVQEDDLIAQQAVIAQLHGGTGIIEDELQDRRLSFTEAKARAQARLALLAARDDLGQVGVVTVTYRCRDINTRTGRITSVNLGPPINLRGEFLIQRVTISTFYRPHVNPTYTVEASSVRFSYDELLRLIREAGQ